MTDLNGRLLAAHASEDKHALVSLYTEAADTARDLDAACFYLTHAYIFALELNHPDQDALHKRLKDQGRI